MYLPGLCLTIVMFLGIHGDRLDSLETKVDALVTYIQTDLLLLRENVNNNRDQISKLADLVNISLTALNQQQYAKPTYITSSKEISQKDEAVQLTDLKRDVRHLQSDMKRTRRVTYEEKRFARQVYAQQNDVINDMHTNLLFNQNKTQRQIVASVEYMETKMNALHNDMKNSMEKSFLKYLPNHEISLNESIEYLEFVVNISATELTKSQAKLKDTIIENQIGLTTEIEEKLKLSIDRLGISINEQTSTIDNIRQEIGTKQKVTNDKLDLSLLELKDKIDVMKNEIRVTQSQSNAKLGQSLNEMKKQNVAIQNEVVVRHTGTNDKISQLSESVVNTLSSVHAKYSDILQGININNKLLERSEVQSLETLNQIKSTKHFLQTLFMKMDIQIIKTTTNTYLRNYVRNTRLANVTFYRNLGIAGRLEVYRDDKWGTVCDDDFSNDDAVVVCKDYGYSGGLAHAGALYGKGEGEIWLDNIACTGEETNIRYCSNPGWGVHDCTHSEDVGIECY